MYRCINLKNLNDCLRIEQINDPFITLSHGLFNEYRVMAAAHLTLSLESSSRHSNATYNFSGMFRE